MRSLIETLHDAVNTCEKVFPVGLIYDEAKHLNTCGGSGLR